MFRGRQMGIVYKKFDKEFPEYKKMSKEERAMVFKKAAAIFVKHSKT